MDFIMNMKTYPKTEFKSWKLRGTNIIKKENFIKCAVNKLNRTTSFDQKFFWNKNEY